MAKFLSEEWIQLYKDEWYKNDKPVNDLKGFTASIKYFIERKQEHLLTFRELIHLITQKDLIIV
jgi:hypothetical protein